MAIWQDLVDSHGFTGGYQSVKRFVRKLRGSASAGSPRGDRDRARRGSAGRLRRRPDGARPAHRQVPPHAAVRADARLQPQVRSPAGLPLQHADLGRTARESLPPAGRRHSRRRARQPARRRAHARHLRSRAQSALPRRAAALRRRRAAVPRREIRIARARSNPASATPRRHR